MIQSWSEKIQQSILNSLGKPRRSMRQISIRTSVCQMGSTSRQSARECSRIVTFISDWRVGGTENHLALAHVHWLGEEGNIALVVHLVRRKTCHMLEDPYRRGFYLYQCSQLFPLLTIAWDVYHQPSIQTRTKDQLRYTLKPSNDVLACTCQIA